MSPVQPKSIHLTCATLTNNPHPDLPHWSPLYLPVSLMPPPQPLSVSPTSKSSHPESIPAQGSEEAGKRWQRSPASQGTGATAATARGNGAIQVDKRAVGGGTTNHIPHSSSPSNNLLLSSSTCSCT